MSGTWRKVAAALLVVAAFDAALRGFEHRLPVQSRAPRYPLSDELRLALTNSLYVEEGRDPDPLPRNFASLAEPLAREFERSPSLFTMLDYGLVLEGVRYSPDPSTRKMPPTAWSDPTFTRMREHLQRYVANRAVPADTLPRREWWKDAGAQYPIIQGNSKRREAYLEPALPSLFKSDVDVFAFGGVPFLSRAFDRLAPLGSAPGPIEYGVSFEPQIDFPTIAPLLGMLAPFVEMMKVQGAGTAEVTFDKPRGVQEVIGKWSAVVDTGSGAFVGAGGAWPVFAITHAGVVKGRLTRAVARGTHCSIGNDDQYYAVFTFDRPLPKSTYAIVQTGVRFDAPTARITTARALTWFARPSYEWGLWYADLDADGRKDIAVTVGGAVRRYGGEDFIGYVYANVNGRWKLLYTPEVGGCT